LVDTLDEETVADAQRLIRRFEDPTGAGVRA